MGVSAVSKIRSGVHWKLGALDYSVPARHISEGAVPCPYCLTPCQIIQRPFPNYLLIFFFFFLQNVIAVFVFSDSRCKNACNCLQICVRVFINRPQNCAHADLVSFACWIVTEFWSFTRKSVPHLVVRALNCARF